MTVFGTLAPATWTVLGVQSAKTVIVVVFLIGALRLLGKRQMSQLTVYDLVMVMAVANAVQNSMTGGRGNLTVGIVVSSTVVIGTWMLGRLAVRRPAFEQRVVGHPTILVNNGQVLRNRMHRENVSTEQLDAELRNHGLETASEASLVILEVDGSISVVPKESETT